MAPNILSAGFEAFHTAAICKIRAAVGIANEIIIIILFTSNFFLGTFFRVGMVACILELWVISNQKEEG